MTDTAEHIKQIQLQLWLAKSPQERLKQMMLDNEALFQFWRHTHKLEVSDSSKKEHKSSELA